MILKPDVEKITNEIIEAIRNEDEKTTIQKLEVFKGFVKTLPVDSIPLLISETRRINKELKEHNKNFKVETFNRPKYAKNS